MSFSVIVFHFEMLICFD